MCTLRLTLLHVAILTLQQPQQQHEYTEMGTTAATNVC